MTEDKNTDSDHSASQVDFAWRVHAATQDWIKNVDQKASITLAVVVGIGGFAAAQVFAANGSLHALAGHRVWIIRAMGLSFAIAGLAALLAVFPSMKRKRAREHAQDGLIYFGHLRHRSSASIRDALNDLDNNDVLGQLASQLEQTSRIAWNKHARLQCSHVALASAIIAFALAGLWH
jgi:hypothetical protein